ncbi:MAG: Flp pilus assembly protein CpaB [Candidatus Omnitrophota bacterium]
MAIEKQKLILISGIVLGIVAILMTKMYLDQQQQEAQTKAKQAIANMQANQTAVLISKQDIPEGSVIEPGMLETAIVPTKFVQPQAVTSLDRISGMVTVAPISKGEQVSLSKLTANRKSSGGDLSGVTPSGKRAISILVDNIASLSGMIKPGDYVDVLATLQIPVQGQDGQVTSQVAVVPLFQNILVLAVGSDTGSVSTSSGRRYVEKESSSGGGNSLITLALGPQEANLITFVQEQGKIRLVLRSPADARVEAIPPASWETLFQYIMPQKQNIEPSVKPVDTTEYVEVLRGLNKEKVPLLR